MFTPYRKHNPLMKIVNSSLIDLPSPANLSIWWNIGSLLGICLGIQLITGIFLSMHYTPNIDLSFFSIIHIMRDVNNGWLMRLIHANGASIFFILLYIHIGRGLYFNSFILMETWNIGVMLFILSMGTAFVGYVLVWGQMSFWGATVITNLVSAIPYIGKSIVEWLWGGFAVENPTLNRFFSLHFLLPFIIVALVMAHLLMLHQTGSNNPLGLSSNFNKLPFHQYFSFKDLLGFMTMMIIMTILVLIYPTMLSDPDNFTPANPLITPIHIKPEWYFLWVYAILRSIPNKLGGVTALALALMMPFLCPIIFKSWTHSWSFYPLCKTMFWMFVATMMLLTWIGGNPIEPPFYMIGQIITLMYFLFYILTPLSLYLWDNTLK